ncbi:MAG: haloacid dehalogenase-like hydrolase [Synergistaceae bacterium]|nr:haloacid dehalogenase-like hydrolase [Synergistota bacterium]NLM70757.1 haloacid dehalogenase-like hydrolase [Synergistaceae bacterium]
MRKEKQVTRRILDANASDLLAMSGRELLTSIRSAEGRTLAAEVIAPAAALLGDVTNAEVARAFGADIILLNMYDVLAPNIEGLEIGSDEEFFLRTYGQGRAASVRGDGAPSAISALKRLVGRPIAINLEPVDTAERLSGPQVALPEGRRATPGIAKLAIEQGVDMLLITGNPATGVTTSSIAESIRGIREAVGADPIIAAGKMHAAGSLADAGADLVDESIIERWIDDGADIVLIPAPGTVPGITPELARSLVEMIHSKGAMAMTSIGTSQEGADESTIRRIALWCKCSGADIHHIGDSGYSPGVAVPENILAYSIAIRGRRHAWRRMAASIAR